MELAYWNVKGRAEIVRILLALFKLPHTEKNPSSMEEALALTRNTGFDFPNLPYLIDGDVRITESSAIPIYIAHKAGKKDFFGKEGLEQVRHQMVVGVLDDVFTVFKELITKEDHLEFFEIKKEFVQRKLQELSKFLGDRQTLFDQLTLADIKLFITVQFIKKVTHAIKKPDLSADHKNLEEHSHRIANLSGIKEYLESNPKAKLPFLPPYFLKVQLD
jgi:glutathione S-transferase